MKIHNFPNREEWLNFRKGKIMGSKLKDVLTKGEILKEDIVTRLEDAKIIFDKKLKKEELLMLLSEEARVQLWTDTLMYQNRKLGYYELIAERLSVTEEEFDGYIPNETPMDRGTRLEKYAIERFRTETKKKVDESLIVWSRDDNPDIAISPDGIISATEAVECKCLSSARHVEAWLTQKIPDEYQAQKVQYFVVNDKLKKLYFVFYDPRIPAKDFFIIETLRSDIELEIATYLRFQKEILLEVNSTVNKLIGF